MNKLLGAGLILWAALGVFAPGTGSASPEGARLLQEQHNVQQAPKWRRWHSGPGQQVASVPELDPRTGAQALTLLLGGLVLSRQRRRRTA